MIPSLSKLSHLSLHASEEEDLVDLGALRQLLEGEKSDLVEHIVAMLGRPRISVNAYLGLSNEYDKMTDNTITKLMSMDAPIKCPFVMNILIPFREDDSEATFVRDTESILDRIDAHAKKTLSGLSTNATEIAKDVLDYKISWERITADQCSFGYPGTREIHKNLSIDFMELPDGIPPLNGTPFRKSAVNGILNVIHVEFNLYARLGVSSEKDKLLERTRFSRHIVKNPLLLNFKEKWDQTIQLEEPYRSPPPPGFRRREHSRKFMEAFYAQPAIGILENGVNLPTHQENMKKEFTHVLTHALSMLVKSWFQPAMGFYDSYARAKAASSSDNMAIAYRVSPHTQIGGSSFLSKPKPSALRSLLVQADNPEDLNDDTNNWGLPFAYTDERLVRDPTTMQTRLDLDQCNACEYADITRKNLKIVRYMLDRVMYTVE